jgi:hypothetical protein
MENDIVLTDEMYHVWSPYPSSQVSQLPGSSSLVAEM